ncbi:MAG: type II toxin-antitoxin system mRNA interferase toxin, RelE/StbE family [Sphingomicrobium sp.]
MRLEWHRLAVEDRENIYTYIEADNPRAAAEIDARFDSAVLRLRDFPNSGRPGRVESTRELVVAGTPYIISYRVVDDRVILLRVLHGAQLWPDRFED